MAATAPITGAPGLVNLSVSTIRVGGALVLLGIWQGLALSGFFFRDVVPPLQKIVHGLIALFGGGELMSDAYESWLSYLGPTPKIILFPVMIMLFGVGSGSKVAMGAVSCFFPIAISVASGVRGVDPTLRRV